MSRERIKDNFDEPPSGIYDMVNSYYPIVCYPIAPIHVYRVLFWHKANKERDNNIRVSDNTNNV